MAEATPGWIKRPLQHDHGRHVHFAYDAWAVVWPNGEVVLGWGGHGAAVFGKRSEARAAQKNIPGTLVARVKIAVIGEIHP